MTRHAPSSNARAYQLLGAGNGRTTEIAFRLPGVRIEMIHAGRHKLCNLTTITPVREQETEINHTIYWTSAFLTFLRPVLRPFVRAFLDQDRQAVALQQEGLRFDPHLMLLGDPDAQARWYFSLKQEFRRAQEEGRSFNNPVTAQILHWRS
jgi:phenylpropionate dioxygenase-like ring-hydroxylating dioxygenase large terminal subunit